MDPDAVYDYIRHSGLYTPEEQCHMKGYEYSVKEDVKQLVESKTMTLYLTHGVSFQTCIDAATPLVGLHILK